MYTIIEKKSKQVILKTSYELDVESFFNIEDIELYDVYFNGYKLNLIY